MTDKKNTLEDEVKFSWKSVCKRWWQNLKDDLDPAIKGAKMGFFGLHAVPTWIRQYKDGKMSSENPLLTGILGFVVAGSFGGGYVLSAEQVKKATDSELAYLVWGVPAGCQVISWAYEALVRAKRSELSKVVMTKLQRRLDKQGDDKYDLTCHAMATGLADLLWRKEEKHVNRQIKVLQSKISDAEDLAEEKKDEFQIRQLEAELQDYKEKSLTYAREIILYVANDIFQGLAADKQLGKKYEMTEKLVAGPLKRQRERNEKGMMEANFLVEKNISLVSKVIKEIVEANDGSANIELFGKVTSVYNNEIKKMHYEIVPSELWNV